MEDWPEFQSVWRDLVSSLPESVQVQHIKKAIPVSDAKRIAGVKDMAEVWKRLEKVHGDTQHNILTVKANLENLAPKANEDYKRVLEVFEAVESAVTQLTNLNALQFIMEDYGLMSKIILKLPHDYQGQFAEYITSDSVRADPAPRWDKFWVWMERLHRRSVESSLMNMCESGGSKPGTGRVGNTCHTCGAVGHYDRDSPTKGRVAKTSTTQRFNMAATQITTKEMYDQQLPEVKKQVGSCPACKQPVHVYTRQFPFGKAEWPSRRLGSCPLYQKKTSRERGELIESLKGCYKCTGWLHNADGCFNKRKGGCEVMSGGKSCGGVHHRLLHGSGVAFCHRAEIQAVDGGAITASGDAGEDVDGLPALKQHVLLEVQIVIVNKRSAKTMFDGGSSGALITHSFAEKSGLKGEMITYWLAVVGHPKVMRRTMLYTFFLVDNQGRKHEIQAYGIDTISEDSIIIDLSGVRCVFPGPWAPP